MPQFDLANATISSTMVDTILYDLVGFVPFVYDDMYPGIITHQEVREELDLDSVLVDPSGNKLSSFYFHNDDVNSTKYTTGNIFYKRQQNYSHTNFGYGGRVPFHPLDHNAVGGQLRIGLGTSARLLNPILAMAYKFSTASYRHSKALYYQVYEQGVSIDGTTYKFPVAHNATIGSGGFWLPKSGTGNGTQVTNADTDFKYTGDDSNNNYRVFSYTFAKQLAEDCMSKNGGIESLVRTYMDGYEDSFPYDNTLAQLHFDIMCAIAYHKGPQALQHSAFLHYYKQVDGTAVTSSSDLDAYNNAAWQLPWMTTRTIHGLTGYRFSRNLVGKYQSLINLMLTGTKTDTDHDLNSIVEVSGDDNWKAIAYNPDFYEGPAITTDFHFAPKDYKPGDYQTVDRLPPGEDPTIDIITNFPGGQGSIGWYPTPIVVGDDGVLNPEFIEGINIQKLPDVDFWTNDSFVVDAEDYFGSSVEELLEEEGSAEYYKLHPIYQSYYADYWQDGNGYFHGKTAHDNKRGATKWGAAIASTGENQLPSFILGLNESGNGTSKVYIRSSEASTSTVGGITSAFDIADGKSMGTIDYGQWNHFAITRSGTTFRTFKNGDKVSEWQSDKKIKIPLADLETYTVDGLDLSLGRSQGADYFYGYLDGVEFTGGRAKYTDDFTVSSTAPTIINTTANYYGKHHIETVASALDKMSVQLDVEYKLRIGTSADDTNRPIPGGTNVGKLLLDVGPKENLFVGHGSNDPTTLIVREGSGDDPAITGLNPESIKSAFDASEYVSVVEYIYEDGNQAYDALDVIDDKNPYRGLNGEKLERAIYVTEPEHPYITREERARAFLNELKRTKRSINLDLDYYDIQGDFEVGDNIFVYDTDLGFEDNLDKVAEDPDRTTIHEVSYQGQYVNPEKIRVTAITWPIKEGYGVYLRRLASATTGAYQYIDITPFVRFESGGTTLEVGDLPLKLGDDLRFSSAISGISVGEKFTQPESVGNLTLTTGFIEDAIGVSQAIIKATWETPLNVDGTLIQNGELYRVRYRKLNSTDPYTVLTVGWGENEYTIEGLSLGTTYEVGVQPVNTNGDFNDYVSGNITTAIDGDAPTKPAAADSIAAGQLRVQIVHSLGRAVDDNGNAIAANDVVDFTLENDIIQLNVYVSTQQGFSITGTEPKGHIIATGANIRESIPAVGEIALQNGDAHYFRFTAVDRAGNESDPSDEYTATGELIGTQFISNQAVTNAKIANLAVTTAKIADASITNAKIGDTIQSDNYSEGSDGWTIEKQRANYPNGYAEFNDAIFRGAITADSGDIGGWSISSSKLSSGNLDLDGSNNYIRGNYTQGSAGFTLNNDGSVEFNDATIRGDLEAGTITIGSNAFQVNSSGQLFMGSSVFGSAPFRVDTDGSVVCTDILIASGEIHIGT